MKIKDVVITTEPDQDYGSNDAYLRFQRGPEYERQAL